MKNVLKRLTTFKNIKRFISLFLVFTYFANQAAFAASEIVGSGNVAAPTVVSTGSTYDVTTNKYVNSVGVNSFDKFNVGNGDLVNLYFNASKLVNLIYDSSASQINGQVNSYSNGTLGGNVVFANSNGFVVGSTGVFNVGSLTMTTPTKAFMDDLFFLGDIDGTKLNKLLNYEFETADGAKIDFNGKVNATRGVGFVGSNINIGTSSDIKANINNDMTDALVNTASTATGIAAVENGKVVIKAVASPDMDDSSSNVKVDIAGKVNANKADVDITSYSDVGGKDAEINLNSGANIKGNNINIKAESKVDATSKSIGLGVNINDFDLGLLDTSFYDPTSAKAKATVTVNSGAVVNAVKDATIEAKTSLEAGQSVYSPLVAIYVGVGTTETSATVNSGASVTAGNNLNIKATSSNKMESEANASALSKVSQNLGSIVVTIANIKNTTSAIVNSGATTNAKNMSVKAESTNKITADTSNKVLPVGDSNNGALGVAAVITDVDSTTTAKVNNNVDITGDLSVEAKTTTTTQTKASANAGGKGDDKDNAVVGWIKGKLGPAVLMDNPSNKFSKFLNTKVQDALRVGDGSQAQFNKIDLSAAFNYNLTEATTTASIGDATTAPVVKANTIKVNADNINDKSMVISTSEATDAKTAIGGAIAINTVDNNTNAFINGDITSRNTDTTKTGVSVSANNSINHPLSYYDDWNSFMSEDFKSLFSGITYSNIFNKMKSNLDKIDFKAYNPDDYVAGLEAISDPITDTLGKSMPSFDIFSNLTNTSNFGLEKLFTTYAQASNSAQAKEGSGTTLALSATVGVSNMINNANAYIAPSAKVTSATDVKINAANHTDNWAMAGLFKLSDITSMLSGNSAKGGAAVGGSVTVNLTNDNASAYVGNSATVDVTSGDLIVNSLSDENIVTAAAGSSTGDKAGITGSVAVTNLSGTTQSYIGEKAKIDADKLDLTANSNPLIVALTIGIATSEKAAFGVGVSAVNLDNIIKAYIADSGKDALGNNIGYVNLDSTTETSNITATSSPILISTSISGALANPKKSDGSTGTTPGTTDTSGGSSGGSSSGTGGTQGPDGSANSIADYGKWKTNYNSVLDELKDKFAKAQKTIEETGGVKPSQLTGNKAPDISKVTDKTTEQTNKFSIAGAGAVNVNAVHNDVSAYIADGAVVKSANNLNIKAENNDLNINVAAGLAYAGKVAAGGAFTVDWFGDKANAYIGKNATVDVTNALDISADTTDNIIEVNAGAAAGKDNTGVGGSIGVLVTTNQTNAYIDEGAKVNTKTDASVANLDTQTVKVSANDTTEIVRAAGAAGYGKNAGVGITIGTNVLVNQTNASIKQNAIVNAKKSVDVNATTTDKILTIGVGGGASEKVAVAGALGVNVLVNSTQATITGAKINDTATQSNKSTDQKVGLNASENTSMLDIAGAAAYGGKVGVGGTSIIGVSNNTVTAAVKDSTVNTGTFNSNATNNAGVIDIIAAGAGSEKVAVSGALGVYVYNNGVNNYISNSTVKATKDVNLTSDDTSSMIAIAGSGAAGGNVGVGGSVFVTVNDDDVNTYIEKNSTVTADNNVTLDGKAHQNLIDVIASGAGGGKAGVSAAIGAIVATGDVNTYVDSSTVTSKGTDSGDGISVKAASDSNIISIVGQANYGGTAGVGGSSDTVVHTKNVNAYVNNSTLTSSKDLTINSSSVEKIISVVVGAGVGGDVGVQGSFDTYVIVNMVNAYVTSSTLNVDGNTTVKASDMVGDADTSAPGIISTVGAVTGGGTAAVGASIFTAVVSGQVQAYVKDTTINSKGNLNINAISYENIIPVIVGGTAGGDAAVTGVVNTTVITEKTKAYADNLTSTQKDASGNATAKDVSVSAKSTSIVNGGTGAGAASGTASVGAAIDTIVVTETVDSYIKNSNIANTGKTLVDASVSESSIAVILGVGAAGTAAVQGALATRVIANEVNSYVSGSTLNTKGDVKITASDVSDINAGLAAIGGAGTAAVGASVYSLIVAGGVNSYLENSTVNTSGTISLDSQSSESTIPVVVSGGGAGTAAVNATTNTVVLTRNTIARVTNTDANQKDASGNATMAGINVNASSKSTIGTQTGQANGAGVAGVGASIDTIVLAKQVKAKIEDTSDIATKGQVNVTASSTDINGIPVKDASGKIVAYVPSVTLGFSGSGTASVQGSIATRVVANQVEASVSNSKVDAAGNVKVDAKEDLTISSIVASGGGSGIASVGASIFTGVLSNSVNSYIYGSTLNSTGDVSVNATSNETIGMGSVSVAIAGYAGVSGIIDTIVIAGSTNAYIDSTTYDTGKKSGNNVTVDANSTTNVEVITGQVSGGIAGVGGNIDTTVLAKTTTAKVTNGSKLKASGTLTVDANSVENLNTVMASGSGGAVAVQGVVGTKIIANTTEASVTGSETTMEANKISVHAKDKTSILGILGALSVGGVGVGLTAATNVISNTVKAFTDNKSSDAADTMDVKAEAVENIGKETISGADTDLGMIVVSGAVGAEGAAGSVSSNIINNNVTSYAKGSNHTKAKTLTVSASDVANIHANAGNIAAGGDGYGASIITSVITNHVEAYLDGNVEATDATVSATSTEDMLTLAVGFAGGSSLGISGSIVTNVVDTETKAYIKDNSTVKTTNNLSVTANDTANIDVLAGAVAVAGVGAVGAAVIVNVIDKDVQSYIGSNANVDAGNTLAVSSNVTDNIGQKGLGAFIGNAKDKSTQGVIAVAGSLSGLFGVAGTVVVNSINNTVLSAVKSGAKVNQNNAATAKATQSVKVTAQDDTNINAFTGSGAAGGIAGAGAAVNVNVASNTVNAYLGNASQVSAKQDVEVGATSTEKLNSQVMSFAAGGVGIAGAIAISSIGNNVDSAHNSKLNENDSSTKAVDAAKKQANDALSAGKNKFTSAINDAKTKASTQSGTSQSSNDGAMSSTLGYANTELNKNEYTKSAGANTGLTSNTSGSSYTSGTYTKDTTSNVSSSFDDTARSGATSAYVDTNAVVKAGRDIKLTATDNNNVSMIVGSAALGLLGGVGASVAVDDINTTTETFINSGATIESGNDTTLSSNSSDVSNVRSYAGAGGGYLALNGSVAYVGSNKITRSYTVDDDTSGVNFAKGNTINLLSTSTTDDNVYAGGASVGLAALGASVAIVDNTGTTETTLGTKTKIGKESGKTVNNLNMAASSTDKATTKAEGGTVGLVGGGATVASTSIKPTVNAYIKSGSDIELQGNLSVSATETVTSASATANGLNIGGFSVGVSDASVNIGSSSKKVNSKILSGSKIKTGGNASVKSKFAINSTSANAQTGAFGLIGGNGSLANTTINSGAVANIGTDTELESDGSLTIQSDVINNAGSSATGRAYGLVAGGYTEALNSINTNSEASLSDATLTSKKIKAGSITVASNVTNNSSASASAGSGGLASGTGAKAGNSITSANNAYTGKNLDISTTTGSIDIAATTSNRYASSVNASAYGAIAAGVPILSNTVNSTVNTFTGSNSKVSSAKNLTLTSNNTTTKNDNGYDMQSGSGGIVGVGAGKITSSITHNTSATLNGSSLNAEQDLKANALNNISVTEKANTEAYGGIPVTDTTVRITTGTNATVDVNASSVKAGRDIGFLANSNVYNYAKSSVYAGGVAPVASGFAYVNNTNNNKLNINSNVDMFAERNLAFQAGGGYNIISAIVNSDSHGLLWDFGSMGADAYQTINNKINIASGATAKAGEELDLWALNGNTYAEGYARGKTTFHLLFGIPITVYKYGGDEGTSLSAYTTLNGNLESGVYNEKTLTLNYDPDDNTKIKSSGTGIELGSETAVPYDQKQVFVDKVNDLTSQMNEELSGDPSSATSTAGGMNADLATLQTTRDNDKVKYDNANSDKTSFDNKVTKFETDYSNITVPAGSTKTLAELQMDSISKFASDNSLTVAPPDSSKTAAEQAAQMKSSLDTAIANQKSDLSTIASNAKKVYDTDVTSVGSQQTAIDNYKSEMNTRISYWNTLASSSSSGAEFYYLPVNSVSIGTGHTSIRGGLSGTGSITAPGNLFRIAITNYTTKSMMFKDLYIDKNADGTIQYNGIKFNNNSNVGGVDFIIRNPNQNKKEIVVNNAYDPDDPRNPITINDAEFSGDSGDLYFTGDIYNPGGDVRITNMTGSVVTEGMISAKNYYVYVPRGAYIQNFSAGVFDTAGSAGLGSIVAGEDVTIIAQMINVNGLIQSGEADKNLTIYDFDNPVAVYAADGTTLLGYKVNGNWLGKETTKEGIDIYDMISDTSFASAGSNIKAYWDGEKIQVYRAEIRGGNITLDGEIVSTGNGKLKVVSGYGQINVTNNSKHDMVINKLNADKLVDGQVILNNRPISSTLSNKIMDLLQNDKAAYNALLYHDGYTENNVSITNFVPATTLYDSGGFSGVISLESVTYDAATNSLRATYYGTVKQSILFWQNTATARITNTIALGNDFNLSNVSGSGLATKATVTYKAVFDTKNGVAVSRDLDAAGNSTINIDAGANLSTHVGASTSRDFSVANFSVADGASGSSLFYHPQKNSVAQTITKSDPIYVPRSAFLEWLLGKQYVYNYTVSGSSQAATSPIAIQFTGYTAPSVNIKSTSVTGAANIYINEDILCNKGNVVVDNASGGNIEEYSLASTGGYQVTNNAVIQGENVLLRTLESGYGNIGTEENPLLVNTGDDGSLYISAGGDISVKAPTADMNLMAATSTHGNVRLEANKEIVSVSNAALSSLVTSKGLNASLTGVAGKDINLISNNSYVNADDSVYLDADGAVTTAGAAGAQRGLTLKATGTISADAQDSIYIENTAGNTRVGVITSDAGDVNVSSSGAIEAGALTGTQTYNIQGKDVNLNASNGKIGDAVDGKELVVNSSGRLTANATDNIGIKSLKDLFINKIVSQNGASRGDVRIISDKNIKDANYFKSTVKDSNNNITATDSNIVGNNLLIVAIGGGIDNINVDLKGELTAYAGYSVDGSTAVNYNSGINISNVNTFIPDTVTDSAEVLSRLNDLRIADLKATGHALLSSEKSILGQADSNVDAVSKDMTLIALNGSVGSLTNYFNIISTGNLTANATDSVYINSPENINIKEMMAVQKQTDESQPKAIKPLNNVYVTSDKSILDGSQGETANIVSKYVNLIAKNGTIGSSADDLNVFIFNGGSGIEAIAKGNTGSIYISAASLNNPVLDSSNNFVTDASGNVVYQTLYSDLPIINMLADGDITLNATNAVITANKLKAGGNILANAGTNIIVDSEAGKNAEFNSTGNTTITDSVSVGDTKITSVGALNVTDKVEAKNILATAANMLFKKFVSSKDTTLTTTSGDIIGTEFGGANITSGKDTVMNANGGSVGSPSNYLDVSVDGTITANASDSVYINSLKDLNVKDMNGLNSSGYLNNAKLTSKNSIYSGKTDDNTNIKAKNVVLDVLDGIGKKNNKLKIGFGDMGRLSVKAIDDVFLDLRGGNLIVENMVTTSDLNLDTDLSTVDYQFLRAENAFIRNSSGNLKISNGIINTYADIYTRDKYVVIENRNYNPRNDVTMQLHLQVRPFYLIMNDSSNIDTNPENVVRISNGYTANDQHNWGSGDDTGLLNYNDMELLKKPQQGNDADLTGIKDTGKQLEPLKFVRWTDKAPELAETIDMIKFASDDIGNAPKMKELLGDIKAIIGEEKANTYYESVKPKIKGNRWYDKDDTVSQVVELMKILPSDKLGAIYSQLVPMLSAL